MEGDRTRKMLLDEESVQTLPQVSPDGRWIAYYSTESGRGEIYVRPFPEVDKGKWQVSSDGGESPLWSPDGRELFYLNLTRDTVMAALVNTESTFSAEKSRMLFRGTFASGTLESPPYDIHPDGKRFLMMKPPQVTGDESTAEIPRKIIIVLNWDEELKRRVPVD